MKRFLFFVDVAFMYYFIGSALNSSQLSVEKAELSSFIPGVRNMRRVRRSLDKKLTQKYKADKK